MSCKRQYCIANRIIAVTFCVIKVFGLWPYKIQHSGHRIDYNSFSIIAIIYSIVEPSMVIIAYVCFGSELFTETPNEQSLQIITSPPLQLIVFLYSNVVIISYFILYFGQLLQYQSKRIAYLKCRKVTDCMRACRTEYVDIQPFLIKFFLKTIVYDVVNFLLFFYNIFSSSEKVQSKPYLTIIIYLPIFTIRLNTNAFFAGILVFNVLYRQLNESLCKIFSPQNSRGELFNFQLEKYSMLYFESASAMKAFNSLFFFQITLWFITQLISLTTGLFYQYIAVVQLMATNESYFKRQNVVILGSIIMSVYEVFTTAHACNSLVKEVRLGLQIVKAHFIISNLIFFFQAQKTADIIHKLNANIDANPKNVRSALDYFYQTKIQFSTR